MPSPIIGVVPLVDSARHSYWMLPGYLNGLQKAGATPIVFPLTVNPAEIHRLLHLCDGILLTGGQDISPQLYGEAPLPQCGETCPQRDRMEQLVLEEALSADLPVLGICRGPQFLNVFLGGTLYQDLPTQHPGPISHCMTPPYDRAVHRVTTVSGSPLEKLLEVREIGVNSYHHQAVCRLAEPLREIAISQDGLVEAAWLPGKKWVWGIQWHPEFSPKDENSRRIFADFVSHACQ